MAHGFEGAFFVSGLAFLSAELVLPAMVKTLGGGSWAISLMPMMMMLGFMGPPLLTAHWVESLQRFKPFVAVMGIMQRMPFVFTGLALVFLAEDHPALVLVMAVLTPFVSGLMGGVSMTAWMELVAKTIPANRRASLHAYRNILGTIMGLMAGPVITWMLASYPGAVGYGFLHLAASAMFLLSYLVFLGIVEPYEPQVEAEPRKSLLENLRSIPSMLRGNPQLVDFLVMILFTTGIFILTPFMGLHALAVTGREDSYLGYFVIAQMVGGLTGNLLGGYVGDRLGGKAPLVISRILFIAVSLAFVFNRSEAGFFALFFLYGFGFFTNMIGRMTLTLEICPPQRRPTFVALVAASNFISLLLISFLSSSLQSMGLGILPNAVVAFLFMGTSLAFLLRIEEPRNAENAAAF